MTPLPADPVMVKTAVERKNDKGEPQYARSISKLTDTSVAEAVLRNGVIFNAEAVVVLSAPATYLAKSLELQGAKELYKERVKRLVIVDVGIEVCGSMADGEAEGVGLAVAAGPEQAAATMVTSATVSSRFIVRSLCGRRVAARCARGSLRRSPS